MLPVPVCAIFEACGSFEFLDGVTGEPALD
jgi:hypothetical protein